MECRLMIRWITLCKKFSVFFLGNVFAVTIELWWLETYFTLLLYILQVLDINRKNKDSAINNNNETYFEWIIVIILSSTRDLQYLIFSRVSIITNMNSVSSYKMTKFSINLFLFQSYFLGQCNFYALKDLYN